MDRLPNWLRWLLVLPAAVVAFWGVQLLVILGGVLSDNQLPNWAYQLINSFASGYAFVGAAAWMAPRGKFPTAIVHTLLVTAFGLLTLVLAVGQSGRQSDAWLLLAVAAVLTIVGGGAACYAAWDADRGRSSSEVAHPV